MNTTADKVMAYLLEQPHHMTAMPTPAQSARPLMQITGNLELAPNRWKYAWQEVTMNGDVAVVLAGARSGTTSGVITETDLGYAVNLAEIGHTATYAWGVDVTATDYPARFAPKPVGGGGTDDTHKYVVVTEMIWMADDNGVQRLYFYATGSHDGECT